MHGILHNLIRRASNVIHLAAFLSVSLLLLTLPVSRIHQTATHCRAPDIRRSIERHVFLERAEEHPLKGISATFHEPNGLFRANTEESLKPFAEYESIPQILPARLLLRLKLRSSRSAAPDPLI